MRQRRGISEHISERKPAFRERDARTEGNFYKSFPHERLVYEAVRRTTSSTTTLVEGTGVLRPGGLENRRSGKTGVPEAAVLGNGVSRKRAHRNGRSTRNFGKFILSFARTIPSRSTTITDSGVILK